MSVSYQRVKMRLTTNVVHAMRRAADSCSGVIYTVVDPLKRLTNRVGMEAPWVIVLLSSCVITIVPIVSYPILKPYISCDKRWEKEAERVRMCLEKGIDPYPYMRTKNYIYGNTVSTLATESEVPLESSWEHRAVIDFQRRKEELRKEVGGNMDDTVEKLVRLKKAQHDGYHKVMTAQSAGEPPDLIFRGRPDTDQLNS